MSKRRAIGGGPYTPSRGAYAGRTFSSRRQYENEIARARGFANKSQRNVATKPASPFKPVKSIDEFNASPQGKAAEAFRKMRTENVSLSRAAREAGTTPANVRRYYGDSLEQKGKRFKPPEHDTIVVPMHVATTEGDRIAYVVGDRDRKIIGHHSAAVALVAFGRHRKEAEAALAPFRGQTIASADGNTYTLVSDFDEIRRLLREGKLHHESPYEDEAA